MRQRKAKNMEERLDACSEYLIRPEEKDTNRSTFRRDVKGASLDDAKSALLRDQSFFQQDRALFLEIGCGKGNFIIRKALEHPEADFLAIEGQETVILRALEKAAETDAESVRRDGQRPLSNLKFMLTFVHSMDELFEEGQLSGIYLNFSDPWPKARHAKRRLTYRERLRDYAWALKKGGFVEFKTDNDDLYAFTLEEIEAAGFEITEQTTDLHNSDYESRLTMTEYEEKFRSNGKNINYVKFVV